MLLSLFVVMMAAGPTADTCKVDKGVYSLDINTFDQDPVRGWRALAERPECRAMAAELMSRYRAYTDARLKALIWHEAQVRADAGDTQSAIALMEQAKRAPVEHGHSQEDWNAYVDATIAFLRNDKPALLKARERLAQVPWPPGYTFIDEKGLKQSRRPSNWPLNLGVVDGLIQCFGHSYEIAYRQKCKAQPTRSRANSTGDCNTVYHATR